MKAFTLLLALVWGVFWALFLQLTPLGRVLVYKRTWITVVVGVGVDLLLLLPTIPFWVWLRMVAVIWLSSLGIITRSLLNELGEAERVIETARR